MPGRSRISLLPCVLALALGGCGSGDGTIPDDESDAMLSLLAATEEAIGAGDCDRAQEFAQNFVTETESLPGDVDPEVAEELNAAAANLQSLASDPDQCTGTGVTGEDGVTDAGPDTTTTTTTEPETETTTTDTTTDTTTEEEPTTTEEAPEEPADEAAEEPAEESQPEPQPDAPQSDGGLEPPSGGVGAGGGPG